MFKKASICLSSLITILTLAVTAGAVELGTSEMNPDTGVTVNWLPFAIAGGVLVVVGIVSLILSKKKKK